MTAVPGLRSLHRSIAEACAAKDPALARATVVLVPTRASAAQLRHTLEHIWLVEPLHLPATVAVAFPDILTRQDWYRRMAERCPGAPRLLSEIERAAMLGAAARDTVASGNAPPFRLRPGLAAEMLAFYDSLRRQQKSVSDFERLVLEDLEPRAEFDRGAEQLLRQTRFLVAAFRGFEERTAGTGAVDEHSLRERLIAAGCGELYRRAILAVGDHVAEPSGGLYPSDFDLLSRIPGLDSIDVLATRAALLAGLAERLRDLLPGMEEPACGEAEASPVLVVPPGGARSSFVSRDREEELRDIARRVKRALRDEGEARTSVVFRRPLPYVYLGRTVCESAGIEHQAFDALPLAAEPFAAALDLVFSAVGARFARAPLLELLRSPQFAFAGDEEARLGLSALDRALFDAGYLGDLERLRACAETAAGPARAAARTAVAACEELATLAGKAALSVHLASLVSFVTGHEQVNAGDAPEHSRHLRARAAVLRLLQDMRAAALAYDDPVVTCDELAASVRRWLESQTFTPARGTGGVQLVDAQAARYGLFDRVHLAGLVAGDWPEPFARNIFYPAFLLARLGWPAATERLAAERAGFLDLLRLATSRVSVSSFTLEDDSIVEPSPLLEDLDRAGLSVDAEDGLPLPKVFADEALLRSPVESRGLSPSAAAWAALREARSPAGEPRFHGFAGGGAAAPRGYTVTGIDRYLECPFKYFAVSVLNLPEEPVDEPGMSPKERGRFVHEVFRAFFAEWQARGGGGIGVEQLDAARALFAELAGQRVNELPPSEAGLERLRLLGSVAAPGLGDIVLAAEAVRPTPVIERLLEYSFEGEFTLAAGDSTKTVRLRGKADRVDVLADGRFRVIDYKLGRAPADSVQLPIYASCLRTHFANSGRPLAIGEALYVAFGDRGREEQVVVAGDSTGASVLEEAQLRVIEAVAGIERGDFPPRPAAPRICATCGHAAVCRKDYVGAD